ncbi:MAG: uroporphyrinogen-III C-methyltransferase [Planctomycetota bacterium]
MTARVYLIGAGPGDPGLLTLRGAAALRRCDVVLYDGLSNPDILCHAAGAEQICVGKHGQSRIWSQDEILAEMLRFAAQGKIVGRLKGGDPAVFARTAEEIEALASSNISFEVIPGITAALAAGSFAGIPITHRELASAAAVVTGHEHPGKPESALDWEALAKFPGTLVVYMGVTTAKHWTAALLEAGKDPATPAALIRRCSLPDQETILCRLDEVADKLTPASQFRPPVIAIIGQVATLAKKTHGEDRESLQGRGPLKGQTLLVARPKGQCAPMVESIEALGGHAICSPAIAVQELDDFEALDDAIARLTPGEYLVFCSANGVEHFFRRLGRLGFDSRRLAGLIVAVVGNRTAEVLSHHGITADIIPHDYRGASLADRMSADVSGRRVTIVRASRGSDELPSRLRDAGADVQEVVAYQNSDVKEADPSVVSRMSDGQVDWVTVTSSAMATNLVNLYGDSLAKCRIAAISPVTAEALRNQGVRVHVVANPYTIGSLLEEIAKQS